MKRIASITSLILIVVLATCSCSRQSGNGIEKGVIVPRWDVPADNEYENFTDLGQYIIDVKPHASFDLDKALDYVSEQRDGWSRIQSVGACSAIATHNSKGEVIIGRNQDCAISQSPIYLTHTNIGKYKTLNITYAEPAGVSPVTYEQLLKDGRIADDVYNALPLYASDSFNEAGLYLEGNMRNYESYFELSGTNPGGIRLSTMNIACMVASNAGTVQEALDYMRNELDMYSVYDGRVPGQNICYMIGDATGEFGLVEIAKNTIRYLPYQSGQANYYQTPEWNAVSEHGMGYGRYQILQKGLGAVDDQQQMNELMHKSMWSSLLINFEYTKQDEETGFVTFQDKDGNESFDVRSDLHGEFLIDENGHVVEKSGHEQGYEDYLNGKTDDPAEYLAHKAYKDRCNAAWLCNNDNYKELLSAILKDTDELNRKINETRSFIAGDQDAARSRGTAWITVISTSVNCAGKNLMIEFYENDSLIADFQW